MQSDSRLGSSHDIQWKLKSRLLWREEERKRSSGITKRHRLCRRRKPWITELKLCLCSSRSAPPAPVTAGKSCISSKCSPKFWWRESKRAAGGTASAPPPPPPVLSVKADGGDFLASSRDFCRISGWDARWRMTSRRAGGTGVDQRLLAHLAGLRQLPDFKSQTHQLPYVEQNGS